jgi:hypothetical protein
MSENLTYQEQPAEKSPLVILPNAKDFSIVYKSATHATKTGELLLPTRSYVKLLSDSTGRSIAPPIAEDEKGTQMHWTGYNSGRTITAVGARIIPHGFDQNPASLLEISQHPLAEQPPTDLSRGEVKNHSIFISGFPVSPPEEMVLFAGEIDLSDFDLITTLLNLAGNSRGLSPIFPAMIEGILQRSSQGKLDRVVTASGETKGEPISFGRTGYDMYGSQSQIEALAS